MSETVSREETLYLHQQARDDKAAYDLLAIQRELEDTPLGLALAALIGQSLRVDQQAAKKHADAMLNGRQAWHRSSPEEKLASLLLDRLGDDSECYLIREVAESVYEQSR